MSSNNSESSASDRSIDVHTSQPPRGRRSLAWDHFEQNLVDVNGELKAVYKYCKIKLKAQSGTSALRGHIATTCPAIEDSVRKAFIATLHKQTSEGPFVFDPLVCRERMIEFIIHSEIPFLKFEDPYLQPWIESMQPTKVKGHQTIRNDCLRKYEELKKELQTELHNLDSRVCLTSDIWTSSQNLGYMVITAHFIDRQFRMNKKIISFKELKYPHTGFAIEEAIASCLTEWDIRHKLFTLTLDNASNNTSACRELILNHKHDLLFEGQHLHVMCCAHILNILVQDGMQLIHGAINKLRELLKHIDSSPSRIQEFNSLALGMGLPSKFGIYLDVQTRWNSTFKMLREALKYKAVINSYASRYVEVSPSEEEWVKAEAICEFLKAFEELTIAVSAHREPTSHKFLPVVLFIRHALKDPIWQTTTLLKELATLMNSKFNKYWDPDEDYNLNPRRKNKEIAFNLVLVIATVLDPRRKADYLDFFFEKVYDTTEQVDACVSFSLEWMRKYFTEYEQHHVRASNVETMTHANESYSNVGSPVLGKRKLEAEFAQHKSRRRVARAPKSEIDAYLEEETEEDNEGFDVLAWWKGKAGKFPVLSSMARDFLAIPLSTVSSESAFSCGGRIIGDTRSSLAPKMLEALVCAKDWLYKGKDIDSEGTTNFHLINVVFSGHCATSTSEP